MASNDRLVETQAGTDGEGAAPPSPPRRRGIHWRRVLLPAVVLLVAFFVVMPVAGTLSGKLSSVTENDQAAFLPDSAESTKSLELETRFAGAQDIPALIVWERTGGLTDADLAAVEEARGRIATSRASPGRRPRRSRARTATRCRWSCRCPATTRRSRRCRGSSRTYGGRPGRGPAAYVTGPGGQFADFAAAFEGIDGKLLFTTVGVILVILLLIYRSPVFLPVLMAAGLALVLAQAVVYLVAKAGVLTVDGQSQGILSVLVLGASTDYALLLISRFKEELHREDSWTVAMKGALRGRSRRSWPPAPPSSSACSACCCPT